MHTFKDISILRLSACTAIFLGLVACDRDSYTTWNCSSTSQTKISMVLRKAQMEFQGNTFKFCGSLGNQSYFDQQCSTQTEQSSIVFIPSSGSLVVGGQEYQCKAL
jgi:hypothetical protein